MQKGLKNWSSSVEEGLQSVPVHFANWAPQAQTNCRCSKAKLVQNILSVPEGGVKSTENTIVALSRSTCLTVHPHCLCLTLHYHCNISFPTRSIPFREGQAVASWVTFPSYTSQRNTHGHWKSIINAVKSFKWSLASFWQFSGTLWELATCRYLPKQAVYIWLSSGSFSFTTWPNGLGQVVPPSWTSKKKHESKHLRGLYVFWPRNLGLLAQCGEAKGLPPVASSSPWATHQKGRSVWEDRCLVRFQALTNFALDPELSSFPCVLFWQHYLSFFEKYFCLVSSWLLSSPFMPSVTSCLPPCWNILISFSLNCAQMH